MINTIRNASFRTKVIVVTTVVALVLGGIGVSINVAPLPAKTITSPQTFDCGGATIPSIVVRNTHHVIIQNCVVTGSSGRGISVDDSSFVTIRKVTITKVGPQSGAISLNASSNNGLVHDILIEDYHAMGGGSMGWAIGGSQYPIKNITVRRALIENVGQAAAVQTHGIYASNWQGFLVEDVTILRSWNSGFKIVGDTNNGIIRRCVIKNSGQAGQSGPGIAFGDSRVSNIHHITIEDCDISQNTQIAIAVYSMPVVDITVDGNYFKNNQRAIILPEGARGWRITNNIGWNQASYAPGREPVYINSSAVIANNFFDNNNWFYDGARPMKIGPTALTFAQWQDRGMDLHSVSRLPGDGITPSPATVTSTIVPTGNGSETPSVTMTPVPATSTIVPGTATPTRTPTRIPTKVPTKTRTVTPTRSATPTTTPSVIPTSTPTAECETGESESYIFEICRK